MTIDIPATVNFAIGVISLEHPPEYLEVSLGSSSTYADIVAAVQKTARSTWICPFPGLIQLWFLYEPLHHTHLLKQGSRVRNRLHSIKGELVLPWRTLHSYVRANISQSAVSFMALELPLPAPSTLHPVPLALPLISREGIVAEIVDHLTQPGVVQVVGSPASGRTTMLGLIMGELHLRYPGQAIHFLPSWDEVAARRVLSSSGYLVVDNGSAAYKEKKGWETIFAAPANCGVSGIIIASTHPHPGLENQYIKRVALTLDESREMIHNRIDNAFTEDFCDQIYACTGGHVGAVIDLLYLVESLQSFQTLDPRRRFSWADFTATWSPQSLASDLMVSLEVKKGFPPLTELTNEHVNHLFRLLLRHERCLPEKQELTISCCVSNGWICREEDDRFSFASPLHEWCIQMLLPPLPSPSLHVPFSSLAQFIQQVISDFSTPPPKSSPYEEFYRCASTLLGNSENIISPELPVPHGHISFYVPSRQWGIELTQESPSELSVGGSWSGPFSCSGDFATKVDIREYAVLALITPSGETWPTSASLYFADCNGEKLSLSSVPTHISFPKLKGFVDLAAKKNESQPQS